MKYPKELKLTVCVTNFREQQYNNMIMTQETIIRKLKQFTFVKC